MLVMGHPQFNTQDDVGIGDGIPSIPEWQLDPDTLAHNIPELEEYLYIDLEVRNVFARLRNAFQRAQQIPFPPTRLHDLTCYVIHRLLITAPVSDIAQTSPITECVRNAIILYMFIIHGPTYYSHDVILNTIVTRFTDHLKRLDFTPRIYTSIEVWFVAIGMVASAGTPHYHWFKERAQGVVASLELSTWRDILIHIKTLLWLETLQGEHVFRPHWEDILDVVNKPDIVDMSCYISPHATIL